MKKILVLIGAFVFFAAGFVQAEKSADGSEKQDAAQSGIDGEDGDNVQKLDKLPKKPNQQLTPNKNQFGKQMNDAEKQKAMKKLLQSMGGGQQQTGGMEGFIKMIQQAKQMAGAKNSIKGKGKQTKKKTKKSGKRDKQHAATGAQRQQIGNLGEGSVSVEGIGAIGGGKIQHKRNGMKINSSKKKKNKPYVGQTLQNMGGSNSRKKRTKKD